MRATVQPALFLVLTLVWAGAAAATPAAPAVPPQAAEADTQVMIDALMPSATRRMRNLAVRQKAEASTPTSATVPALAPAASASASSVASSFSTSLSTSLGSPPASSLSTLPGQSAPSAPSAASVAASPGGAQAATVAASAAAPAAAVPAIAPGPPPSLALAIQFERNSARVRPESGAVLGSLVAAMQSPELKGSRFLIEGHADPRGGVAQNQRLSQERADEVRLYLVSLGVHPARLRAVGKGASQLADAGDPGAAANRRVRVVTLE